MVFDLAYDIRQAGCRDWFLVPLMLLILLVTIASLRKGATVPFSRSIVLPLFPVILCGVLAFLTFFTTWGEYWTLLRQLNRGEARELKGVVSDFRPAPSYKETERFKISGHEFSYSRFETRQGFHTLAADGGPIVKGAYIRLLYIGNHILRLEVGRVADANSPQDAARSGVCTRVS